LAVKATPKAIKLINDAKSEKNSELSKLEIVKYGWKPYIPTIISGISTITCIWGNHYLNQKTQASLMSAYAVLNNSYQQYIAKTKELYGDDNKIIEEIAKDQYNPDEIDLDEDKVLFFDYESMQYFYSTINNVLKAEDMLNSEFAASGWVTLNEFYEFLGLENKRKYGDEFIGIKKLPEYGDDIGWQCDDRYYELTFTHRLTRMEDGLECYILTFDIPPRVL
jgi:hypothetical protein